MNIENVIAKTLVRKALSRGWLITVHDGEEVALRRSGDFDAIWKAMQSTDEDNLIFFKADGETRIGWVWLIWGNGEDLISDHTAKAEIDELVAEVNGELS